MKAIGIVYDKAKVSRESAEAFGKTLTLHKDAVIGSHNEPESIRVIWEPSTKTDNRSVFEAVFGKVGGGYGR